MKAVSEKVHRCRRCRKPYKRLTSFQVRCVPCLVLKGQEIERKQWRQEKAQRKRALLRRTDWVKRAQAAFNRYIRMRDQHLPCICCGKPYELQKHGGSMDAGHYHSVGSTPKLRFDEDNVFGQRKNCNRPGGTTRAAFTAGVRARIGEERFLALEQRAGDQNPAKFTIADLQLIEQTYKTKAKTFEARDAERNA